MASFLERFHLKCPKILLPKPEFQAKWAVVACDQYTSEPEYWNAVAREVGESPSMLHMVLPELYLDKPEEHAMIPKIHESMRKYLREGVFDEVDGMVYIERKTRVHPCRRGLMVAMDLEGYEYMRSGPRNSVSSPIRPTEGTIVARIPPRLRVRLEAPIESPHIMVLIDDPKRMLIEPLGAQKASMEKLYDVELMQNSGHLTGYRVPASAYSAIEAALTQLSDPAAFQAKYHVGAEVPLLTYAIGDGNHSLATAKKRWTDLKEACHTPEELAHLMATHPARYALVEICNLYDEGIEFEPIHRVLFEVSTPILADMQAHYGPEMTITPAASFEAMIHEVNASALQHGPHHAVGFCDAEGVKVLRLPRGDAHLPVGALQAHLDAFIAKKGAKNIDYVHGDEVIKTLGSQPHNCSFYLPPMSKHDLFPTVIQNGVLPRKTFSMGHADEKRFYYECRAILPM
ncbi:putative Bifunctional protein FolD [Paratrimastix pyriformis]|uniref:Bifunctional protein FolD n=1 Tax=Paratrimastix pyriformis TaxID=342808 RepID=A0ABQ8UHG2_9EUKA|nr:putative Bifunctional protein FolD [Paratrimastix pyriformis]